MEILLLIQWPLDQIHSSFILSALYTISWLKNLERVFFLFLCKVYFLLLVSLSTYKKPNPVKAINILTDSLEEATKYNYLPHN